MAITHKDRFNGSCISNNGRIYLFKIYDKNWSGATNEISAGSGGIKIKYDTSGQEKFSPIIASKCTISLVIDKTISGQWLEQFITSLRETYEEGDVTLVIWNNSNISNEPLWSGNVTIDLSAKEDVSKPYEIELTATDGIGLLKNYDMVATQGTNPYSESDTYISDGYQTFIYWIKTILEYCNTPDSASTDGDVGDYTFSTAIDWWYEDHPAPDVNTCPLDYTQAQMLGSYEVTAEGLYKVKNVYEVLESICKMWGMRVVFWKNRFWFTQVGLYNTADIGTLATPDNVDSQIWTKAGVFSSSQEYLGDTWFSLYSQDIETNAGGFKGGLQKLEGSKWDYYPKLKEVSVDFESISNNNYFINFPLVSSGGFSANSIDNITSSSLGTITGASGFGGFNIRIDLQYDQGVGVVTCARNWSIRAKPTADSDFANGYFLRPDTSSTHASGLIWDNYPGIATNIFRNTFYYDSNTATWIDNIRNSLIFNPTALPSYTWQGTIYAGIIPTDSNFTGDWDFEIFTLGAWIDNNGDKWYGHHSSSTNAIYPAYNLLYPPAGNTARDYYDVYDTNGNPVSQFNPVLGSVIGGINQTTTVYSSRSETQKQEVKDIWWGDTPTYGEPNSLIYDNGAGTTGYTQPTGLWRNGRTATFNKTLSELLCEARLFNQQQSDYKWSLVTAVSEENRSKDDGTAVRPVYINPVGRIQDTVEEVFYYMLRGSFNILWDEWQAEWLEVSLDNSISTTTSTTGTGGVDPDDNVASARLAGSSSPQRANELFLTSLRTSLASGTITSIPINALALDDAYGGVIDIIKSGDKFILESPKGGYVEEFEASADVGDTDTTISVVSKAIAQDFDINSSIIINNRDLYKQYQHKTRGTVAGFTVDSDGITKGGIEITDWLDSDTMEGASATSLPTSESVKAYVDSQVGASDTLSEVLANGNTTGGTNIDVSPSDVIDFFTGADLNYGRIYANSEGLNFDTVANRHTRFFKAGTETMRIDTAGNVGIGTTSPASKLDVYDSSSIYAATITNHNNGGKGLLIEAGNGGAGTNPILLLADKNTNAKFTVIENGNVGIGTTSPGEKLEVNGIIKAVHTDSTYAKLRGNGVFFNRSDIYIAPETDNYATANIGYNGAKWGNVEINAAIIKFENDADEFMRITSDGNIGIGTTAPDKMLEVFNGDIKIGDSSNSARRLFFERNTLDIGSLGTNNTRLTLKALDSNDISIEDDSGNGIFIEDGGNVGIGTTAPSELLHVEGAAAQVLIGNDTNNHKLELKGSTGYGAKIKYTRNTSSYAFYTGMMTNVSTYSIADSSSNELLSVKHNGLVGIGTTAPSAKLEIAGTGNQKLLVNRTDGDNFYIEAQNGQIRMRGSDPIYMGVSGDLFNITNTAIGIGTTAPASELHVDGATTLTAMAAPSDPTANDCVIWLDSTTLDLMVKITGEASTVTRVIASFEE